MRRVAVVAPADALRDVLVCVANAAAVEIDDGNRGQAAPGQAARRLQHAGQALPEPALSAVSPDLDGLERTARYDLLAGEAQLEGYAAGAVSRSGAAALAGWMPAERLPALAAALAEAGGALVPLRHPRGIDAPTLLGDQAGQAPLRPLVQTYGTVPYADIDPTWLAWAAYVLMFGMMFGDAGQGLLLVAAAGALHSGWPRWARRFRQAWPFVGGAGLAATVFGVLYGEFFGPTGLVPAIWLDPLSHPVTLLLVAAGIGAILLAGAYALGTVNRWREGGWASALYAPSGIAGTSLFLGAGLAIGGWYFHQSLILAAGAAVGGLRDEPGYDQLLERLTGMARQAAGPDAVLTAPAAGGSWRGRLMCSWTARCPGSLTLLSRHWPLTCRRCGRRDHHGRERRQGERAAGGGTGTGRGGDEEGYPASLSSALAAFYERSGRVVTSEGREGSVTIIGAVSPAGGDMTEPVTTYTQRFVRSLWTLDRDLAYARHYPAVSWSGSFSRDIAAIAAWHAGQGDPGWADRRSRLAALLAEADRLTSLAELMGASALPARERATILAGRLVREGLLQQSAISVTDAYCDDARAAALTRGVLAVAERCLTLVAGNVSAASLEEQDFSPILRAREEAATPDAVAGREHAMLARLDTLGRHEERGGGAGPGPDTAPGQEEDGAA